MNISIFFLLLQLPKVDLPMRYPRHLTSHLKARYDRVVTQFYQLQHLWEVQLKDHRDYWNIKAAHDFWCENGTKTIHGRQFGFDERWLINAVDQVRMEVLNLEDSSRRIKRIRAIQKNHRQSHRHVHTLWGQAKRDRLKPSSPSTERATSTEPESPTRRIRRRRRRYSHILSPQSQKSRTCPTVTTAAAATATRTLKQPHTGTRDNPILIIQDTDDKDDGKNSEGYQNLNPTTSPPPYSRQQHNYSPSRRFSNICIRTGAGTLKREGAFITTTTTTTATSSSGKNRPGALRLHHQRRLHPAPETSTTRNIQREYYYYSTASTNSTESTHTTPIKKRTRDKASEYAESVKHKSPKHHSHSAPTNSSSSQEESETSSGDGGCPLARTDDEELAP
jgi:hypothetical protein